ncbi:MAG TPA: ribokinase [Alphaproteobacteria bacterium]|nr:ribokinase [Alphaproteobacteria bacterium]
MIIVFGSNVLDLFFHTPDLPPHDTARFLDSHDEAPGGKGANQAVACAKAGGKVYFSGALGKGGHGRQMFDNLSNCGVDVSGIRFLEDTPSGLATIFVDEADGTHRIVVSQGANLRAKQSWIPDHLLGKDTIVLVQGELPIEETEALLARAKKTGARTVMNFAPATQPLSENGLRNLDVIVLNEHEADLLGKKLGMQTEDKVAFSEELYKRFDLITIVTLGPDGSVCCSGEGLQEIPSLKIKAIDTVGAGDAFVGYLTAGLDNGLSLNESLRQAAVAGSLACTKVGAQTALPLKEEVSARIEEIQVKSNDGNQASKVAI